MGPAPHRPSLPQKMKRLRERVPAVRQKSTILTFLTETNGMQRVIMSKMMLNFFVLLVKPNIFILL